MSPVGLLRALLLAVCMCMALALTAIAQDAPMAPTVGFVVPSAQVEITGNAILPSVITVTVGAEVHWTNSTGQEIRLADHPDVLTTDHVYLPAVTAPETKLTRADAVSVASPNVTSWTSDIIAPGGQFSRTFFEPGRFPYYASHMQGPVGAIVVLSDTLASTVLVDADAGGVVVAGGSQLEVPPGALAQDTAIVVSEPISGTTMQADGMMLVMLEPSGLQFSKPATLTISYADTESFDEDLLEIAAFNEATGEWEAQQILDQDKTANTATVSINHFSNRVVWIDDPLYIVLEIPSQFLPVGSVLTRMGYDCGSSRGSWLPGHSALYVGRIDGLGRIIESNRLGDLWLWEGLASCTQNEDAGVHQIAFGRFIVESCGFYMGAGVNPNASAEQRQAAVNFAVEKLNSGYLVIGQGNQLSNALGYQCYSCVGLLEYAFDKAGAGIIPDEQEAPAITPLQMYRGLDPVDEITAQVGEQIKIPVKGLYLVDEPFAPDYYVQSLLYPQATSLPNGSTYSNGTFEWTPQSGDEGKVYQLQFSLQLPVAGKVRSVTQTLKINVTAPPLSTDAEVLIPAGPFQMGCDPVTHAGNCISDEKPLHLVNLSGYYIDKYEVTNARYKACVDAGKCTPPQPISSVTRNPYYGTTDYADYPVINVTWKQAQEFCSWSGKRLPTEAEWEKAAKGSSDTRKYPWGNEEPDCSRINYYPDYFGDGERCQADTSKVGSYPDSASPYGVMDMAGNVFEFVNDWYSGDYYSVSPGTNPKGPATGLSRVLRGGSWWFYGGADSVRTAYRFGIHYPGIGSLDLGFRCARSQ